MVIETQLFPADEPWYSLGYTGDRVRLSTACRSLGKCTPEEVENRNEDSPLSSHRTNADIIKFATS